MADEPQKREGEFDETTSYSFLYFLMSGALLFVTLWSFWDDEYIRRGFKEFQDTYYKEQYARAERDFIAVSEKVNAKEQEIQASIASEEQKMAGSDEYQELADAAWEAQNHLNEVTEEQKAGVGKNIA